MATISLDVPDAQEGRIYDAFATAYGYQDQVDDPDNPGKQMDNPQTKADFTKERIAGFITSTVSGVEAEAAATAARTDAIENVNQEVVVSQVAKQQKPKSKKPAKVPETPSEPELFFAIPASLAQATVNYLVQQPYTAVAPLIKGFEAMQRVEIGEPVGETEGEQLSRLARMGDGLVMGYWAVMGGTYFEDDPQQEIVEPRGADQAVILSADAYEDGLVISVGSVSEDTPVLVEVG